MWECCRAIQLVGGFSRESSVFHALAFQHCFILASPHSHWVSRPNVRRTVCLGLELQLVRVIEVRMEQLRNERVGEIGDPQENQPTSSIVRRDCHMQKFKAEQANSSATAAPAPFKLGHIHLCIWPYEIQCFPPKFALDAPGNLTSSMLGSPLPLPTKAVLIVQMCQNDMPVLLICKGPTAHTLITSTVAPMFLLPQSPIRGAVGLCAPDLGCGRLWVRIPENSEDAVVEWLDHSPFAKAGSILDLILRALLGVLFATPLDEFEKGCFVCFQEVGWIFRRITCHLNPCELVLDAVQWEQEGTHTRVEKAQVDANGPHAGRVVSSCDRLYSLLRHRCAPSKDMSRQLRIRLCPPVPNGQHDSLQIGNEEWCFSDESRFCLDTDDCRFQVWRCLGQRRHPCFIVKRYTTPTRGVMVCQLHFQSDDIIRVVECYDEKTGEKLTADLAIPKIRENAIPSILPECPSYLSTKNNHWEDPNDKRARLEFSLFEASLTKTKLQTDALEDRFGRYRQFAGSQFHVSVVQLYESEIKLSASSAELLRARRTAATHDLSHWDTDILQRKQLGNRPGCAGRRITCCDVTQL
ncbi:hypothetical protein PR048_033181 [Dryococelus australis]|uniref:Uncharacterized protein n=1 Tax=Dryococelus australis TaxID=614101 RepID=A0ABQ9G2D1_9NEOP|nr:hypothetical protein PR048_033181 [Dryococelus australis]